VANAYKRIEVQRILTAANAYKRNKRIEVQNTHRERIKGAKCQEE